MAHELSEFDGFAWTEADEQREDVPLAEVPEALSDRAKLVLKCNAVLRQVWDESRNGYPSDSERAYAIAWHAGACGLTKEDTARLLVDFYGRPGKKRLHGHKLTKTLRAWAKAREEAERQEQQAPQAPAEVEEDASPLSGNGHAPKTKTREAEPYEVLPAAAYRQASFAGAVRLVPSIGLTECGVGLVTGAGGDGKSLLALNLSAGWTGLPVAMADAIPAVRQLRVLLVPVEDAPGMVQERYNAIRGAVPDPEGLCFFTRKEPMQFSGAKGRPNDHALARLRTTMQKHGPFDVVTFDPLCYLHQAEENSSSEMMRWLVPLREVCRQEGAALLIVHHAGWAADGEDARGRGSTAIRAWADFELALRAQTRNGRTLHRLNLVKCNFASRWKTPLTLELDARTLRFDVVDETGVLCSPEALVAWLRDEYQGTWDGKRADLYAAICKQFGCEERTAREALKRAKDGRLIIDKGQRMPLICAGSEQCGLL